MSTRVSRRDARLGAAMPGRTAWRRCARLLAFVLAAVAAAQPAGATAKLTISTTCFTATGPDGNPYTIYGQRFTVGKANSKTPAIVLVHGVESDAGIWDLTPTGSVARSLANAGYVVIAYDRLGYRYSAYTGADGGDALTVGAQQAVLHDIIDAIHSGRYRVGAANGTCGPSSKTRKTKYRSKRVAIIGHSAGGFIVSS